MKLTKSILSPARAARDSLPSQLSSSLSRRLRTNGSLKGGASPFFTTKKRGCGGGAFDNPEPSSPKVTCIGQVRVKTRKKVRQQTRSLSRRRSGGGGEVSFRKSDIDSSSSYSRSSYQNQQKQECFSSRSSGSNSQKWAYFPSICEGFSCLFPCSKSSSSCFSNRKCGGEERRRDSSLGENGCGAVFTRWLVSVNDGEGGKRREIELVVGGEDEEEESRRMSMRSSRRHVFEDIQVMDDRVIEIKKNEDCFGGNGDEEEEKGRVSICIPPKNALLLMRCRSDPMKVAALAGRFSWDANGNVHGDEDGEEEEAARYSVGNIEELGREFEKAGEDEVFVVESNEMIMPIEAEGGGIEMGLGENGSEEESVEIAGEEMVEDEDALQQEIYQEAFVEEGEEVESNMSSFEALLDQENAGGAANHHHYEEEEVCSQVQEQQVAELSPIYLSSSSTESDSEQEEDSECSEVLLPAAVHPEKFEKDAIFDEHIDPQPEKLNPIQQFGDFKQEPIPETKPVLPDCLLLMMCEPKLSMEVSKETWVCSTDFIRWLPERPAKKSGKPGGGCEHQPPVKRRLSTDAKPKHLEKVVTEPVRPDPVHQPARSSCSLPPKVPSMATMIEQKLVNATAYEPLVLTRCKSEPMRTAAAKLMPDSFYWKNAISKLEEPHRRATVGAAAGVGC